MRQFFGILLVVIGAILFIISLSLILCKKKSKQWMFPVLLSLFIIIIGIVGCFTTYITFGILGLIPFTIILKNLINSRNSL